MMHYSWCSLWFSDLELCTVYFGNHDVVTGPKFKAMASWGDLLQFKAVVAYVLVQERRRLIK